MKDSLHPCEGCPSNDSSFNTGQAYDPHTFTGRYLGPHLDLYAAYANKDGNRERISSGGIVTTVLQQCLEESLVDGVALARCAFENGDIGYRFSILTDPREIPEYGSSAYFNIPIERHWKELDQFDGKLAICCLPCHCSLLRKRQESLHKSLHIRYIVSLFCGHNNEAELIRFVLRKESIPLSEVIDMQVKRHYLSGVLVFTLNDGRTREVDFRRFNVYRSLWFFSKNMCRQCDDHLGAQSDMSVGDIFTSRYRRLSPKRSAVVVRTGKGRELMDQVIRSGKINYEKVPAEEIFASQKRVIVPSADLKSRYYALRWNGYAVKKGKYGRFRIRSFLTYTMLYFNDRLSQRKWGRKVIGVVPRPLLYGYIALIKLINHSLKP